MAPLVIKSKQDQTLVEPVSKIVPPKKPSREKMHKAIDAYAAAAAQNASIAAQIKALEAKKQDMAALEQTLFTEIAPFHHEDLAKKDAEFIVESKKIKLKIGKMGTKREIIDMNYVFTKMKKGPFLQACTFPLASIDAYLTPAEKAECIKTSETKRNVSIVGTVETK